MTFSAKTRIVNAKRKSLCSIALLLAFSGLPLAAQTAPASSPAPQSQQFTPGKSSVEIERKLGKNFFNLLNMAGTKTAADFTPMNQRGRNQLFFHTMVNPLNVVGVAFGAGIAQWSNKPGEWGQGSEAYGRRYANLYGQFAIGQTVSFAISSALDEDNRYFNSGKKGFWTRTGYALESGFVARHRDGHRTFSFSQVGSIAAASFLSRLWLPPSRNTAGDAAINFALGTATNVAFGVVKEFIPDIIHVFSPRPKPRN
jgi:hypothetical protein